MFDQNDPAPDRYVLISALLALHEEAASLDEDGIGQRTVELAEQVTESKTSYLHVVEKGVDIRLASWSARTLSQCTIESESHYSLDRAGIWADCVRQGKPVIHNELEAADFLRGLPEGHSPLIRHLAVPVLEHGQPVMVVGVGNKRSAYTDEDVNRVRLLAESAWGLLRRKAHEQREARHLEFLEANMLATIDVVSTIVEMRDPYTAGHERRVRDLACAIAAELDLDDVQRDRVAMAAQVHDVGKLAVPAEVLAKPARLTPMEMEVAKTHSRQGYEILRKSRFSWPLADIVLQHHERWDGSGYPDGLRGEEILIEARIIGVADVVEAMSSPRPYRPRRTIENALVEIESGLGTRYDPRVAAACLRLFREKGYRLPEH
ncbi:HD domain-containing phosphohydrolase [Wenzhouxiangella sp. XN24]|uniref:HD-GYP domain-containing protein n=1 Tax=Wenzhouxiangella sp. XN24 TaxID=2713569 RepID=UPI0013ED952B|nr:HD domain-containing phosphohydrolase [Wenzhouxiangella sp. XN24]NGX15756.1 GAF domain-containing protein [Wenzhouxiangella sp. XN24]